MFNLFPKFPSKGDSDGIEGNSDLSVTASGIPTELESLLLEGSDRDDRLEATVDETSDRLALFIPPVWLGVIVLEEICVRSPASEGSLVVTIDSLEVP